MNTRTALILLLLVSAVAAGRAQAPAQFAKANQEYGSGDFNGAVQDYEELVRAGQDTPNLFYNLGNAYFRMKNLGRAILNYERALALDPHHPEAEANLRIARDEARALELVPDKWERRFGFASENHFVIIVAVAFWIFAFALAGFIFSRRRSLITLLILSLLVLAIGTVASSELEHGRSGNGLAIVTGDKVEARLATADNASRILALPAGSEIKVVSQRGDWIYAALPNDLHGWMLAKSAEQVRM
jgi:tetratricopeptide (TPR) repeat protein